MLVLEAAPEGEVESSGCMKCITMLKRVRLTAALCVLRVWHPLSSAGAGDVDGV